MKLLQSIVNKARAITLWDVAAHLFVFAGYYIFAKLGLFLFFDLHSSPALIWPPFGIAVGAVYFGGYAMLLPILLAQFLSSLGSPVPLATSLIVTLGYVLQALAGGCLLRYLQVDPSFRKTRDAIGLVLVAFVVPLVGPSINIIGYLLRDTMPDTLLLTLARSWAGGVSSILIVTPLIMAVYAWKREYVSLARGVEIASALAVTVLVDILIFWTPYAQSLGISVIFLLPAVFIWFVLRMHPRWLTIAVFTTAVVGITGSIVAHASVVPLNQQLLSDELYIAFISAMFLVFAALTEERHTASRAVEQNNKELTAALSRLSEEDRAKTEFIAILAHELRNPLAPIVSAHEWLLLQEQTPESKAALESAQKHSTMIRHLLDDLLDSVRVSEHTFSLKKEPVSLLETLNQSIESTADFLQSRRHSLRVVRPEEDVILLSDPIRLEQILINLLNNAGKYTEPGGAIELSVHREEGSVVIGVTDNGIGIDPAARERIFNPFHREGPATHLGTGLGIGLSLTKRLVDMHEGTIDVQSDGAGQGSTFIVRLPLPATPLSLKSPVAETPRQSVASARIVIVDDNIDAVAGLKKLLEHNNHQVEVAYNGAEALAVVEKVKPELLLLDIGLPDINGYEVARRLRERGFKNTIVALTGYGQKADKEESNQAGFDYHLVKPVGISDILSLLSKIQKVRSPEIAQE